ncbi:MAG: S-layer homology domain-containing protein [Candidatus Peribacteraceae bacterium]
MAAISAKKRVALIAVTGASLLMILGAVVYRSAFSMPSKGDLNSAPVAVTVEETLTNPFKDQLPPWALEAIVKLYRLGIVTGYQNGNYGPADPVTRGQITTLLYRILRSTNSIGEPAGCVGTYTDVAKDHYAFRSTCLFKQQGWSGDTATFQPDVPASRGVTAAFLTRSVGESLLGAMGATLEEKQDFDDIPIGSAFYRDTATVNVTGLMTGYPNGDFGAKNILNRAEAAVVIYRTLKKIQQPVSSQETHSAAPEQTTVSSVPADQEESFSAVASCAVEGCDDGNDCTTDTCDLTKGCVFQNAPAGTACDDGDSETTNDVCTVGKCVGTEPAASSSSSSVAINLCANKDCNSGNQCMNDSCDPATGTCVHSAKSADTPCNDNNPATVNDVCDATGTCLGKVETPSCATIKTQSFASATNGTVTAYDKDYGLYLCTSGSDIATELEPQYGGVNFPAMSGDNLVYYRNYGIVLYNVPTKQKTELEPASSGSNNPAIGGKYVAYFKNYGIVIYNIETKQKTQVEQPNSGCNNPSISGTTLTYSCNYQQKTYNLQ